MFDTHCHLNFKAFDGRVEEVIDAAKKVGVSTILIPGTDIESSKKAVEIAEKYEGIYAAVGIHPHHVYQHVTRNTKHVTQEIKEISQLLKNRKVVAVGEIGLDRYIYQKTKYGEYRVDEEFIKLQKEYFVAQLKLAREFEKTVIIHCREAKKDLLEILGLFEKIRDNLQLVFHCCEPDKELLTYAIHHNIYIGVDGDVTYDERKQSFIKEVPIEMLVLETDSPFLAPVVNGEKIKFPNTPANLKIIVEFIANLKGEKVEKIIEATSQNAKALFKLLL